MMTVQKVALTIPFILRTRPHSVSNCHPTDENQDWLRALTAFLRKSPSSRFPCPFVQHAANPLHGKGSTKKIDDRDAAKASS
jgi:hypothetical protein